MAQMKSSKDKAKGLREEQGETHSNTKISPPPLPPPLRPMGYTRTQRTLLLADSAATAFWAFVAARLFLLYPLTGARFLPGGIADFYLTVLLVTTVYDVLVFVFVTRVLHIPNTTRSSRLLTVATTAMAKLVLAGVVYRYPRSIRSELFPLILLFQSLREFITRSYHISKVLTHDHVRRSITQMRNFTYLLLQPLELITGIMLVFQALAVSPASDCVWPSIDENTDAYVKQLLRILLALGPVAAYLVYRRTLAKYSAHAASSFTHTKEE
jgi:predicted neutral ceramidase superfamily lipid hydrolase